MVKIIIRGQLQSIQKEEAKEALSFFSDYLLGRRLSKNIYIHVTFDPSLFELHNELGYMSWTDVAARCPRKFIVKIDAQLNKEKALLTMAHEMVHIKQYARGELRDMVAHSKKWMGEVFSENYEYSQLPWEVQALKMEPLLYQSWIEYKRK